MLVEVIPLVFPDHATGEASERGAFANQFVAFLKDVREISPPRAARARGFSFSSHSARARRVPQLKDGAHESLTFDEWTQFLEFSLTHAHDPQCKEYDEAAAWPLLIDDFVDYIQRDDKAKK